MIFKKLKSLKTKIRKLFFKEKTVSNEELIKQWELNGRPVPPPHVIKQKTILEYQRKYNSDILIETGTFLGQMVTAQKPYFKNIYSIEVDKLLYEGARKLFENEEHVHIIFGDSGKMLNTISLNEKDRVLYWLDGHYSGGITSMGEKECPILEELDSIFKSSVLNPVILIDDARCFVGDGEYPTLDELSNFIKKYNQEFTFEVNDDIIRITF